VLWDCLLALRLCRDFAQSLFLILDIWRASGQKLLCQPPPAARSSLSSTLSVLGQLNVVSGWSPAPQGPGVVMTVFVTNHHSTRCPSV
jgi:hypothetical protein